ncbi:MAG TPA: lyase family protein, partial [Jatrophihabitantaceae bacterium]
MSLFDPIFGASAVVAATDDRAWLRALCEVEAALARACARVGVVELETAARITTAADGLSRSDPAELGRAAAADGNPVIPLVAALRAAAGEDAAAVHLGATSQDVLDTATMLIAHRALAAIVADLSACSSSCARLARDHRDTPMAGRTLLQQAVPTTFGALAAVWGAALDRARAGLAAARGELPVQLGGAAGTLAGLPLDVVGAFAAEVGLAEPGGVWHTDRTVVAELAGALGVAAVAIGKVATDVVLLAQTEIGEVREQAPGGSSIMAHKQNPIAAITARAGAAQAPGLVGTLLSGEHELQRAAGAWHAEWPVLVALLRAVGGAAS